MSTFLVGISWSDPEEVAACKRIGLDDDARCSTGLFVESATPREAVAWAKIVAAKYMEFVFNSRYPQEALEVFCWVVESPASCAWKHCLDFFQKVSVGQCPDFQKMTAEAYSDWCKTRS